jgi:hypothetical protein
MTHEVTIFDVSDGKPKQAAYFGGYANGAMYAAFEAWHYNNGVSGSGEFILASPERVRKAIEELKEMEVTKNYLDPDRFPDFYRKIEGYLSENPDSIKFQVVFH